MSEQQLPAPTGKFQLPETHGPIPESDIDEEQMTKEYMDNQTKRYQEATAEYDDETVASKSEAA